MQSFKLSLPLLSANREETSPAVGMLIIAYSVCIHLFCGVNAAAGDLFVRRNISFAVRSAAAAAINKNH
jgi:hypothetical protein